MIINQDNEWCTGCGACYNACTQKAITMEYDKEGFIRPQINESKCIHCLNCEKKCPHIGRLKSNNLLHPFFYVAYSKDDKNLVEGSSGGIFALLAKSIISQGGIVYGAEVHKTFEVNHNRADNLCDCKKFYKSKYLQSNTLVTYKETQKDLEYGRMVLYSGTPCQIAGLYSFLGKNYDNLYTVDLVCHGVPSQAIFNEYIKSITSDERYPIDICWRDKRYGWRPNYVSVKYSDGTEDVVPSKKNPMQKGFLYNLFLRKSCFHCPYAKLPRIADITLGDNWGYKGPMEVRNNNTGLSMIISSTEKGDRLFSNIKKEIYYEIDEEVKALGGSRHVALPPEWTDDRELVMEDFIAGMTFAEIKRKYIDKR